MNLLAIDTASTLCAASVLGVEAGIETGRAVLDIGRGHAEHLITVVLAAMRDADVGFADLGAVAVCIGPGSFTGVRVGVSAARGFALALKIPAVGVTVFEAMAAEARDQFGARPVMCALDAGRGEVNAAVFDPRGGPTTGPLAVDLDGAVALARQISPILVGSAAAKIAEKAMADFQVGSKMATADIRFYAMLASAKGKTNDKPRPLYLRGADAKPQGGFVLPRQRR